MQLSLSKISERQLILTRLLGFHCVPGGLHIVLKRCNSSCAISGWPSNTNHWKNLPWEHDARGSG
jgi:hypothetical protein